MSQEQEQDVILEVGAAASGDDKPKWVTYVSIGTLLMAMISAVGILLAGITLNEFFIERTEELMENTLLGIDQVSIEVLQTKSDIFEMHGQSLTSPELAELERLKAEAAELAILVAEEDKTARTALLEHEFFAIGVTFLTVAIALSAMATLSLRKLPWFFGIFLAIVGIVFLGYAATIWL